MPSHISLLLDVVYSYPLAVMSPLLIDVGENARTNSSGIVETDLFIVGAGPAGAGLACFLGSYGKPAPDGREARAKC